MRNGEIGFISPVWLLIQLANEGLFKAAYSVTMNIFRKKIFSF